MLGASTGNEQQLQLAVEEQLSAHLLTFQNQILPSEGGSMGKRENCSRSELMGQMRTAMGRSGNRVPLEDHLTTVVAQRVPE
ncbi:hypothetical protein Baya_14632 [Bagarius yarrelli]|uniref:Uncharacterized protein n=1 Tax=Bagarius yarrelli TaxID=175774 RepID=A0A556V9C0_BAGYA|nr:hypothetical protein Baya_14632 [Bagarius yarrelli]